MKTEIAHTQHLNLIDSDGRIVHGCSQDWFGSSWQRRAGCGPTTATNLLIYHHQSGRLSLPVNPVLTVADGLTLMDQVWHYVTPSAMGVHTPGIFHAGILSMIADLGAPLVPKALLIPKRRTLRPPLSEVVAFIRSGLSQDSPVAFLNLSNGTVRNLDPWHWVTVTALDDSRSPHIDLEITDNLNRLVLDLQEWLESTALGGGFVYLAPPEPNKSIPSSQSAAI